MADRLLDALALCALVGAIAVLALVLGYVGSEARLPPAAGMSFGQFLLFDPWDPASADPRYGIAHAWVATLAIVGLSVLLATPFAVALAVFLNDIAPASIRAVVEPALQLLAGVPAVVYGFVGAITLVPLFERFMPTGESILVASIVLAVMILPFIAATAAESLAMVPVELKLAGASLGVSRWHVMTRIALRVAGPGIVAGIVLGLARGLGETLAVLMLAGNSPLLPTSPLSRGQPLTALIATDLGEAAMNSERYHALYAAGLILMLVVVMINIVVYALKRHLIGTGSRG